jgi:pyruvate dehydrogenase E1 component beta subunit
MAHTCLKAAQELEADGIHAEVLDLRTLAPLDIEAILGTAEKTGRVLIAHEAPNTGSWAAEISALIHERALLKLQAPVRRVGSWDIRMPLFRLEKYYIPDSDRIIAAAKQTLSF